MIRVMDRLLALVHSKDTIIKVMMQTQMCWAPAPNAEGHV